MLDTLAFRPPIASEPASFALDPVALTMLAVNQLGPATIRTAASGKAVTLEVADARVARIFRAALDEMQKTRRTDRLVGIRLAEPA
jgi:hypothetical protein